MFIISIHYCANTSNESNLSTVDDLDSNCMVSSSNDGLSCNNNNKLYPKLPYQSSSASFIKSLHSMSSNENLMQYKDFLSQQANQLIKKSNSLIAKASDLQDEFNNNNYHSSGFSNVSTPIKQQSNMNEIQRYYSTIPEHKLQCISGMPYIQNRQIDKHLQKFEKLYNDDSTCYFKYCPPPNQTQQAPLSYTYTEF